LPLTVGGHPKAIAKTLLLHLLPAVIWLIFFVPLERLNQG
jgi:hypothetical protein